MIQNNEVKLSPIWVLMADVLFISCCEMLPSKHQSLHHLRTSSKRNTSNQQQWIDLLLVLHGWFSVIFPRCHQSKAHYTCGILYGPSKGHSSWRCATLSCLWMRMRWMSVKWILVCNVDAQNDGVEACGSLSAKCSLDHHQHKQQQQQ